MPDATAAPAARAGDPTGHPGTVGPPGVLSVLIGGKPAATVGTAHLCSPPGSSTVFIGGQPAARVGDLAGCGSPVLSGCPTVLIGG
jgi:uncharacterized Zn-binding protein involved in type VI secretion